MLLKIILILELSHCALCSVVLDTTNQEGIYLSDYCPKMKYCAEGAHVMCMYYNPNRVMGPRCRNAKNISMTTELANKMLDVSNAVRSKIAKGNEKGKNGDPFPRGYGIFRLKWDSELATFAQVLANQCVLRHDLCRATKKFPDPGQTAGLVRCSYPDWIPISKSGNFSTTGLDEEKLMYAATQSLKTWYGQKSSITADMLTSYPDWSKDPNKSGRLYMEMIYGPATHMGCGISAYTEYAFYDNGSPVNYNSIQIICNYSARPKVGTAVFNTVPPLDSDNPFNRCGCPAGSMEDDDCLCLEIEREPESPKIPLVQQTPCPPGMNCDPTVVLLPIFTVEDAPPDQLLTREKLANASLVRTLGHPKIVDSFEELFYNTVTDNRKSHQSHYDNFVIHHTVRPIGQKGRSAHHKGVTVRIRHFEKKSNEPKRYNDVQKQHEESHSRRLTQSHSKSSVFAKTPRFELPGSQRNYNFMASIKRDVVPRKDFSEAKKLANKYLYDSNNLLSTKLNKYSPSLENTLPGLNYVETVTDNATNDLHNYLHPKPQKKKNNRLEDVHFHDILTTETILNTAEEKIMNDRNTLDDFYPNHNYNPVPNTVTEDNDKKLMALLDTLEQEVKHIELRENEKKIFDAKIKKIYGTVVGKSSNALINKENSKIVVKPTEKSIEIKRYIKTDAKRFGKRNNKLKTNMTNKNYYIAVTKIRPNILEDDAISLPNSNTQKQFNNGIDVSNKNSKQKSENIVADDIVKKDKEVQKIEIDYVRRNQPKKVSNNIATEDFIQKSLSKDTDQVVYERMIPRNDIKDITNDYVNQELPLIDENVLAYSRKNRPNLQQNINNIAQRRRNQVNSYELVQYRYGNGYNERKTYRNENYGRGMIRNNDKPKHRSNSLDYRPKGKSYYDNDLYEDPLSDERRKYYQAKLDSVERKLQETKRNNRRKDIGRTRHMKTLRINGQDNKQMNSIYTSGQARFLHAY